jgi:hypothetical protein
VVRLAGTVVLAWSAVRLLAHVDVLRVAGAAALSLLALWLAFTATLCIYLAVQGERSSTGRRAYR